MDSVNGQQNAPAAGGEGSAADQAQSTDNAMNSSPGGNSSTSPQAASGTPNSVDKVTNNNSLNDTKAPSQNSTAPAPPLARPRTRVRPTATAAPAAPNNQY
ncbi:hypothetical protein [Hymenobacter cellulosilyticus]|uniref:Uncharacterized protein n=1 Tax=Hymenobacter cellulosilyticus TaxID=2932248 RepID=A0A8T9Q7Z0_9BACT|nr:hypothetical protein [Hymenobacter cellulosilyticus]UOQ71900.1 hypothetical protein MUN79_25445 [Hymenobacter cellulosilyticus]